jgi:carboxyl-terminal processing protease
MKTSSKVQNFGLVLAGAVSASLLWHAFGAAGAASNADTYKQLNLFGDVFDRVRADYVEQPDEAQMIEAAINGMLASLDPHSSFMNKKQFQDMSVQTRGEFGGLGIEVTMENGVIKVVSPIDDTPASRAGIMANDLITKIDGVEIQGMTLNDAVDKMRGKIGTEIVLTIQREGKEPFEQKLMRDRIRVQSVKFSIENNDIGYIRISSFTEQTQEGLEKAMNHFRTTMDGKVKGYILDLRNDPGGLLDMAISVSDSFLDRGEVVSTRGRHADETQRFNATKGDLADGKPVVILINGGSASASEIVAGALQDHKRATIIGTRSFGKGSVQTIIPMSGGEGALRLTTARYYTPAGRSIQAKGIDADIVIEQELPPELQGKDVSTTGEAGLRGHLSNEAGGDEGGGSSAYVPEDRTKDMQLKAAVDFLNGVKVVTNVKPKEEKPVDGGTAAATPN